MLDFGLICHHLRQPLARQGVLALEVIVIMIEVFERILRVIVFFVAHIAILYELYLLQLDQRVVASITLIASWTQQRSLC